MKNNTVNKDIEVLILVRDLVDGLINNTIEVMADDTTNEFIRGIDYILEGYTANASGKLYRRGKDHPNYGLTGSKSRKAIGVVMLDPETGEMLNTFGSLIDAMVFLYPDKTVEELRGYSSAISKVCKGTRKIAYGYKWQYTHSKDQVNDKTNVVANLDPNVTNQLQRYEKAINHFKQQVLLYNDDNDKDTLRLLVKEYKLLRSLI